MVLKISARKSDLARLQAYFVSDALKLKFPELKIEFFFRESLGDKNLNDPLWKMPEKGVFTEDFYKELIEEKTDMVVHSWKDLPTEGKPDTEIVATLPRADQRDVLIFKKSSLKKAKLKIFSSSPRRIYNIEAFLKQALPWSVSEIQFDSVRGNIPTRVRKTIEAEDVDGLIVAKAALDRLLQTTEDEFQDCREVLTSSLAKLKWMALPLSVDPNAAAQGAIAIEIKKGREDLKKVLLAINCENTFAAADAERQILAGYGGGCHQKIGVAVLKRPFGEVLFEKGLTDKGQVLSKSTIYQAKAPKFSADELWISTASDRASRESFSVADQLKTLNHKRTGFWISRVSAWPNELKVDLQEDSLIWAAGVKTWFALAEKGLWINGCSDSLGEQEPMRTEVLAGPREWIKFTHTEASQSISESSSQSKSANGQVSSLTEAKFKSIATYKLDLSQIDWKIDKQKFFYWKSGSQFLEALKKFPQLREAFHASGAGTTHNLLKKELGSEKVFVFWNEQDWRNQCTL